MGYEPKYVKVYDMNLNISYIMFNMMTYATEADSDDEDGGMVIVLDITTKKRIANKCGVTLSRVNHTVAQLKKEGLLRRIGYAIYQFNPYKVGKGKWSDITVTRTVWDRETKKDENQG